MTAGRLYCIQSWNNASAYSGEQIGSRLAQSRGIHFNRDGTANLDLYREEEPKQKAKPKTPIQSRIVSQNVTLNRLDLQEKELEQALDDGTCSMEEYIQCKRILDGKRARAIKSLNKALGIEEEPNPTDQFVQKVTVVMKTTGGIFDDLSNDNTFKILFIKYSNFINKFRECFKVLRG